MYAVIETGSKQYRVHEGDVITVEKLGQAAGEKVQFDKVLIMGEGADIQIGTPYLDAIVYGEVVEEGRGDKLVVYKYKAKKDSHSKQGHRQPYTKVEITGIGEDKPKVVKKEAEPADTGTKQEEASAEEQSTAETDTAKAGDAADTAADAKADDSAEAAADSTADDKGVSMAMKKDELIAYAEEHGISVNASSTKQEIIDAINSAK
jgi:large subunit ribosomal protein L21